MNASPEYASFARLVESLRPLLDQVVVVGGWAHRLYRLHAFVQLLRYEPLATLDADIALPMHFKVTSDETYRRLASNGFKAEFLGHHKPPAAHYRLIGSRTRVLRRIRGAACRQCRHQTTVVHTPQHIPSSPLRSRFVELNGERRTR